MVGGRAATTTSVRVEARVSRPEPERWVVALGTRADGFSCDRTLEASTFRELGDAVVVILAWMIDPTTQPAARTRHRAPHGARRQSRHDRDAAERRAPDPRTAGSARRATRR